MQYLKLPFAYFLLSWVLILSPSLLSAQRAYPLVANVTVDSVMEVRDRISCMGLDPISGNLFYSRVPGEVLEVHFSGPTGPYDTVRYTTADHGIPYIQGMTFHDSLLFLSGNEWSYTLSVGLVVRGELRPDGTREWTRVAYSDPYPMASPHADHGFSGIAVDPTGMYVQVASGSRTHMGEVRDNDGAWPGVREVPMTTRMFRFPIDGLEIHLPNDSAY